MCNCTKHEVRLDFAFKRICPVSFFGFSLSDSSPSSSQNLRSIIEKAFPNKTGQKTNEFLIKR